MNNKLYTDIVIKYYLHCRAWNAYGKTDTTAYVRIVGQGAIRDGKPATIVHQPVKDVTVALGEDITVSLRAQGQPKPKGKI